MPRRVLRQCLLLALYLRPLHQYTAHSVQPHLSLFVAMPYLMVLPVLSLIHCGMGRFCFCAFASFCFVRNDLWDCTRGVSAKPSCC